MRSQLLSNPVGTVAFHAAQVAIGVCLCLGPAAVTAALWCLQRAQRLRRAR